MEIKWNFKEIGLVYKPKSIQIDQKNKSETYGKFICQPLEKGYGLTIGNSLEEFCYLQYKDQLLLKLK